MKSAYNRAGFSVLVLYLFMGLFQVLFMLLGAAACLFRYFIVHPMEFMLQLEEWKESLLYSSLDVGGLLDGGLLHDAGLVSWVIGAMIVGALVGTLIGILVMRKMTAASRNTPDVKKKLGLGLFLLAVLMTYGVWGVGAMLGNISAFLNIPVESVSLLDLAGPGIYVYYAYAVLGAPIVEELAFRKTLIDATGDFGSIVSAFVTAMLFGLIHGNSMQFFLAFNIGLMFACIYRYTGRIVYTMLLHGMINLTATLPEVLGAFGMDIWYYWNYTVLGLVVLGLIVLIIMAAIKHPMLHLERPEIPRANHEAFANPGMIVVCIAGMLLMLITDLTNLYSNLLAARDMHVMITMIPLVLSLATVITVMCTVGRRQKYTDHEETEILQILV